MADIPQDVLDLINEKIPPNTPDESQAVDTDEVNAAITGVAQYTADEVARLEGGIASLPPGGTTAQVLAKASNVDGDVEWVDQSGGSSIELTTPTPFTGSIKFDKLLRTYAANSSDITSDITVNASGAVDNGGARLIVTEDGGGEPTLDTVFKVLENTEDYDATSGNSTAYVFVNISGIKKYGRIKLGVVAVTPTLDTPTFSADAVSDTEIDLTSISYDSDSEAMTIERATDSGFTTALTSIYSGVPKSSHNDTGLTASTHYYYRIKTTATGFTDSDYGYDDDVTDSSSATPLNAPTSLAAGSPTADGCPFTWTDTNTSPNESSYLIQITTTSDTAYASIVTTRTPAPNATSAVAGTGLSPFTGYRARIKAVGNGTTTADSAWSSEVTFTTIAATLNAPTSLAAGTPTVDGCPFTWNDTNTTPAESSYLIQIAASADTTYSSVIATRTPAANATSAAAGTGLTASTAYRARIKAVGNGTSTNDSAYSSDVTFTTVAAATYLTKGSTTGTITESPAHSFAGAPGAFCLFVETLAGANGSIEVEVGTSNNETWAVGLDEDNTLEDFGSAPNWKWFMFLLSGNYYVRDAAAAQHDTGVAWVAGDFVRITVTGTALICEKSSNNRASWTTLYSYPTARTSSGTVLYGKLGYAVAATAKNVAGVGMS